MNQKKNVNHIGQIQKGFTLVEVLVVVFIFSLTMISIVSIFSKFVVVQKRSRAIQQNLEDAKYAMELMSKTIRTSSVISCNGAVACPATTNSIEIFDISQKKCIIYRYSNSRINSAASGVVADKNGCTPAVFAGLTPSSIVNNTIGQMTFRVSQTQLGTRTGKVTVSMVICSSGGCAGTGNDRANIQTTVSLRDYQEAGS